LNWHFTPLQPVYQYNGIASNLLSSASSCRMIVFLDLSGCKARLRWRGDVLEN